MMAIKTIVGLGKWKVTKKNNAILIVRVEDLYNGKEVSFKIRKIAGSTIWK